MWVVQPLSAARDWARTSTRPSLVWRAWTRTSISLSAWLSEVAKSNRDDAAEQDRGEDERQRQRPGGQGLNPDVSSCIPTLWAGL